MRAAQRAVLRGALAAAGPAGLSLKAQLQQQQEDEAAAEGDVAALLPALRPPPLPPHLQRPAPPPTPPAGRPAAPGEVGPHQAGLACPGGWLGSAQPLQAMSDGFVLCSHPSISAAIWNCRNSSIDGTNHQITVEIQQGRTV